MVCKALLLASIIVISYGLLSAQITKCDDSEASGTLVSAEVSDCNPNAKRCILKRNTNATLILSFSPKSNSDTLTAVVHGSILGVLVPFDLPNPDGCKDSGVQCPIKAGSTYRYTAQLPIQSSYPRVTVNVKWQLQDSDGNDIICVIIPSKIQ